MQQDKNKRKQLNNKKRNTIKTVRQQKNPDNRDDHSKHLDAGGKSQKQPVHTLPRQENGAMILKKIDGQKYAPWVTDDYIP